MTVTTNNEKQTPVNNAIVLARDISGVSINGLEFLLDGHNGPYREFETKEDARAFIREEIFPDSTDEEQDNYFTFMTVDEVHAYEKKQQAFTNPSSTNQKF